MLVKCSTTEPRTSRHLCASNPSSPNLPEAPSRRHPSPIHSLPKWICLPWTLTTDVVDLRVRLLLVFAQLTCASLCTTLHFLLLLASIPCHPSDIRDTSQSNTGCLLFWFSLKGNLVLFKLKKTMCFQRCMVGVYNCLPFKQRTQMRIPR